MSNYLNQFSCCIITKGHYRSLISDLQRHTFYLIPNALVELLTRCKSMSIDEVKAHYTHEVAETIDSYISFLLTNELAFLSEEPEDHLFPALSLQWTHPSEITNAIIDFVTDDYQSIANQLDSLNCSAVQLRIYQRIPHPQLENFLQSFAGTCIESIYLLLPYIEDSDFQVKTQIIKAHDRVESTVFHGYTPPPARPVAADNNVFYSTEEVLSAHCCGLIQEDFMVPNITLFSEAQHHNTCLNRKIAIDQEGHIKNCPSMPTSYGHIEDTTLREALEKPAFQKYWNLKKDNIHVCQDCEFRYVCTDCRAYVEDPSDLFSKPLKCGYNPYTGEWSAWSTNPLKTQAIQHYGLAEIVAK